ncbi:unnamed protein product [Lactuca saligna]|uniref:Uncharacterized protein n=1 Tax=Lactuca saligna TaxID=75948 RepID=A0AA36ENL3_LACSI|nr:unnamed protein product [Lactuca saligna]
MSSPPPTHTSSTIPPASVAFFLIESEERSCRSPSSPIESGILRRVDGPRRLKTAVSYARSASTFVENILFSVHVLFIVPGFASIFICYLNLGLLPHPLLSLPVAEYNSFFVADSERLEGNFSFTLRVSAMVVGFLGLCEKTFEWVSSKAHDGNSVTSSEFIAYLQVAA